MTVTEPKILLWSSFPALSPFLQVSSRQLLKE